MLRQIKTLLNRSRNTVLEDVIGTATIFSVLFVGLHLPPY